MEPKPERQGNRRFFAFLVTIIVAAIVLIALVMYTAPDLSAHLPDVSPPDVAWSHLPSANGSITRDAGSVVGVTFRVRADTFDARSDRVYALLERRMIAFDAWQGTVEWSDDIQAPDRGIAPPVSLNFGGHVFSPEDYSTYVVTEGGGLRAYNDTADPGSSLVVDLGTRIVSLAAYSDDDVVGRGPRDLVLVSLEAGTLVALRASNLAEAWRSSLGSTARFAPFRHSLSVVPVASAAFSMDGDVAYAALDSGAVVAVNTSDGAERWRYEPPQGGASAPPSVYAGTEIGDRILVPTREGALVVLDSGGSVLYTLDLADAELMTPVMLSDAAYVASKGKELIAVELGDFAGSIAWRATLAGIPSGPPAPAHWGVVIGDDTGRLYGYASWDGLLWFRTKLCGAIAESPAMWTPAGATFSYAWTGCKDGSVFALELRPMAIP